jgi:hypothetical protein
MAAVTELRVRTKVPDRDMEDRAGKCPGDADYDVLLTGPAKVVKLDGRPLAVYLPAAVAAELDKPGIYGILHELHANVSRNRGLASGSPRFRSRQTRSYTRPVSSAIIGAIDPGGQQRYCRLTSWTGTHLPQWQALQPLLAAIAGRLAEHVPDRYAAQLAEADRTDPAWVVPGTPFTTVTVNNTFSTGTHTDRGDLDAGFSTICCARKGHYAGGRLVFPQYRIAADLGHGDLMLMDAHEWHGNTLITCPCGTPNHDDNRREHYGPCTTCGAERITLVSYFRTKLTTCGSPADELRRADAYRDHAEQAAAARFDAARLQAGGPP